MLSEHTGSAGTVGPEALSATVSETNSGRECISTRLTDTQGKPVIGLFHILKAKLGVQCKIEEKGEKEKLKRS